MSFGNIFIIIMTFFAQFIFIGSIWLLTLSVLLPSGVLWNKQKRKKNQAQKHDFVILCVFPAENTGLLISLLKCFRIIIYSIVESKANVFSIKKNMKKKWFFYHFYVIVYHLHHRWCRNDIDAGQKYEFLSLLFACLVVIFETKSGSKRTNQIIIM